MRLIFNFFIQKLFYRFLWLILNKNTLIYTISFNFFKRNFLIFKKLINFYCSNFSFQLLFSVKFKYSWIYLKNDYNKFYPNFFIFSNFNNFSFIYNSTYFNKYYLLNKKINFKNKFGFFKKIDSIKNFFFLKNYINKNDTIDNYIYNDYSDILLNKINIKNFDLSEKKTFFYKNNRFFLKLLFNKSKKIELYFNKFIKKISKTSSFNFFNFFNFNILNVLINSHFFFNKKDVIFFLDKKYIFLNGSVINFKNKVLKKNDMLSISYNYYFYFIYKNYLNDFYSNQLKYFNFFKKNKKTLLKNEFNFFNKFIFLKNDVSIFIEVDYINMSIIILYTSKFFNSNFNLKILNVFFKRLNNWKYLT